MKRTGRIYKKTVTSRKDPSEEANVASREAHDSVLWDRRLGQFSSDGIRQGVNKKIWGNGPQRRDTNDVDECVGCNLGK